MSSYARWSFRWRYYQGVMPVHEKLWLRGRQKHRKHYKHSGTISKIKRLMAKLSRRKNR